MARSDASCQQGDKLNIKHLRPVKDLCPPSGLRFTAKWFHTPYNKWTCWTAPEDSFIMWYNGAQD